MIEEKQERVKKKYTIMEKVLQLEPLEKALVIITDDQTQLVKKYQFYTNDTDELEMLASVLTKTLHDFSRNRNMSHEEYFSFLEIFFEEIKDKHKKLLLRLREGKNK
jgi:hypothetical protein